MYQQIFQKIKEFDTIIIHRHQRPDGDALGSQIGFKEALKTSFPQKQVFAVGDTNERLAFVGKMDEIADEVYERALVFVLDTAEEFLISDYRYVKGQFLIKMDHHIPRGEFGNLVLVDTNFESCAGLISDFLFQTGMKLNTVAAQALFTGIVTDSGRFRYDSVTAKTLATAAKLLEYDFSLNEVYSNLYIEELKIVRLRAYFTLNFQLTPLGVAYMKNTAADIKNHDVDLFTISRGMVNTMAGIKGIDIWANFTEDESTNTVICELRSNQYNINAVAAKYGGGGHQFASGATLKSFAEADLMLQDLDNLIKENSK
ncbi:MAG TPA: bifunctional oligoribonuclease/PAP phosphatase NrnA [Bacilli bacterium]|nr:MAG: Bifunctional oligoribonuclease and PAP phosphatase NrnA [Tenericutes bacterium ADurb.BinA124]HNZ49874.1 bifunctional oligoribonuclease/PAP phosphatase NrnA [Bacilli bacterium]HOH17690.1 bifunctional oligoribonuclease/PAP phosphatase NrnA [Bacilli bacterium]HPX84254.1 bifunctional oligoribonuclease/PAP phosphatase NrnA [Bacilli bacterium]HQC74031.1 bifunctional oligoribonuclease/PAP phosphatase NrnA [Bacilli bacterium]